MEKKVYSSIGETLFSHRLPNGATVLVVPKPGYKKFYAFYATDYGGADRRFKLAGEWIDTPAGVAHFLEHKMFDMPDGENALTTLSNNGASPNAFTSSGITAYHFECTDRFEENLRCLLNFVSTPYFTPESVAKEQGIIGQEIRMTEDSPPYALYYNLLKCLYEYNPIRDSVAGTVESIAEITDQTLYYCHSIFYNPSNMVLCVAGDVDPERVVELAEKTLPEKPGEVPQRDYGAAETPCPVRDRADANMEVSAPQFFIGAKLPPPGRGADDQRNRLVGALALQCLAGPSSSFYTGLYAEGLLTSDFSAELECAAGTATALLGGESRDPEAVFKALGARVADIAGKGLDEQYFARVKRAFYGSKLRELGDFSGICYNLAEGYFAGWRPFDGFSILDGLTAEDCEKFIARSFGPEKLAMSVVKKA